MLKAIKYLWNEGAFKLLLGFGVLWLGLCYDAISDGDTTYAPLMALLYFVLIFIAIIVEWIKLRRSS